MPLASVIMPVYNAEPYLGNAIESILNQTFTDFEFLIFNDGSTDNSAKTIADYAKKDKRVKFYNNTRNVGYLVYLNKGLIIAKGKYIIRMDSDDVSLPQRFEKQIELMENRPDIGLCSCWVKYFGATQDMRDKNCKVFTDSEKIKGQLLVANAFPHPSVVIRKAVLDLNKMQYNLAFEYAEDYELWTRMILKTKMTAIPEFLLDYRIHSSNISKQKQTEQQALATQIKVNYHQQLLERALSQEEIKAVGKNWISQSVVDTWVNLSNNIINSDFLTVEGKKIYISNWLNTAKDITKIGYDLSFKQMSPFLFYSADALVRKAKLITKLN